MKEFKISKEKLDEIWDEGCNDVKQYVSKYFPGYSRIECEVGSIIRRDQDGELYCVYEEESSMLALSGVTLKCIGVGQKNKGEIFSPHKDSTDPQFSYRVVVI